MKIAAQTVDVEDIICKVLTKSIPRRPLGTLKPITNTAHLLKKH